MSLLNDLWAVRWNKKGFEYYRKKKHFPADFDEKARETLAEKYPGRFTDAQVEAMLPDMRKCYKKYLLTPTNYLLFDLANKSEKEKSSYVSEKFHLLYSRVFNEGKGVSILRNKYKTYLHFRPYYRREAMFIQSDEDFDAFAAFVAAHPRFVVKPGDLYCGNGVSLRSTDDAKCLEDLFMSFRVAYPKGMIVEEPVLQSEAMGRLHPSSVNTVRAVTVKMKDRLEILFMMLRIGQGGSFVDNGSAGGVFCDVDVERGVVTAAADHTNKEMTEHPTTGVPLIGFEIPDFAELKSLLHTLANSIDGANFIGWDMAHTDQGWVMIEANSCPQMTSIQILRKKGIKPRMQKLCREFRFGF